MDFLGKYDQIRSFQRIWSYLLKKSLMENYIFCAVKFNWFAAEKANDKSKMFQEVRRSRQSVFCKSNSCMNVKELPARNR